MQNNIIEEKIEEIKTFAKSNYVPIVRDNTIERVKQIICENNYKNILEIGTAIGYSGIIMLSCSDKTCLTTIEKNVERFNKAKENFEDVGLLDRTTLLLGDAQAEIERLAQKNEKFDFIFLDGPKGQYVKYLPYLKGLLSSGGTLFADNILLGGLLKNEAKVSHKNRTMVRNMKEFLSKLNNFDDFDTKIYEIDDGFTISKLKNSTEQ